ncbi:hypothetical protein [Streptomyces sp. NPDC093060]|uniref:hypothetical protein n=1 Tax=Streptomyces sp. NPDC093060 TaxID=3366019 RepID=UPI00382F6669
MTNRPYTDDDLRAEAARQHYVATTDPDFMGIGEQMVGTAIRSRRNEPRCCWHDLDDLEGDAFGDAQRAIADLLGKAADVSEWAINLGADGLEPSEGHVITVGAADKPIARIHFAFEPGMPDEMRDALVQGIGQAIDAHL